MTVELLLLMVLAATTIMVVRPATPASPVASCPTSKSPNFLRALAKIKTAVAMPSIIVVFFNAPFASPPILLKIVIAAIKSANKTVMAPRDTDNLSLSTSERDIIDAVKIAIADAILSNVPACS